MRNPKKFFLGVTVTCEGLRERRRRLVEQWLQGFGISVWGLGSAWAPQGLVEDLWFRGLRI